MNPSKRRSPFIFGVLALILFAAAVLFQSLRPEPPKAPPTELDRSSLTNLNGRLFAVGQTNPFTGVMIESYPDGSRKSRSEIVEGQLHGESEGFYPNGQRQIQEFFKEGVSDGVRTRWETNGVRQSAGRIVAGEFDGEYRKWHTNGQVAELIYFEKGKPHGIAKAWYPSGFLKSQVEMDHGETKKQETWEDGEKPDNEAPSQ